MSLSNVRAILFDLDGTLYDQTPLRILMAMELCTLPLRLGSLPKARDVIRAIKRFRSTREELRDLGCPSHPLERLQYHQPAVEVGLDEFEMERIIREWMYRRPLKYLKWCRRKGVVPLFAEAKQRGIQLGVFSDYPAKEKLQALELDAYAQLVLCATDPEINAFKPHPRGFLLACERWGIPPEEVLYVGDRPEVDAKGAEGAGMRCLIVGEGHEGKSPESKQVGPFISFQDLQHMLAT